MTPPCLWPKPCVHGSFDWVDGRLLFSMPDVLSDRNLLGCHHAPGSTDSSCSIILVVDPLELLDESWHVQVVRLSH